MDTPDQVKCVLVQATESNAQFVTTPCEMETTHRSFQRAVAKRSTTEALDIAAEPAPLVRRAVAQLLSLIRPLSFC